MAHQQSILLLLALAACTTAYAEIGRATFYGKDGWSIHHGSCGYGYLDEHVGTGWDTAAISDTARDFGGSCGKCKEVKCKKMTFKDGYGASLDRNGACYDEGAAVVVTITDTCPCHYPGNAYSNKRWCCGDMYHFDLSVWAFEKLADQKLGVIAVEHRDVGCNHKPNKPARNPWGQRSGPDRGPPGGWNPAQDKRVRGANHWHGMGKRLLGKNPLSL